MESYFPIRILSCMQAAALWLYASTVVRYLYYMDTFVYVLCLNKA